MERTLIIVKPEGVQRGLVGQVVARFESKGLKIVGLKLPHPCAKLVRRCVARCEVDKCAASGHAAALPSSVMNSRRLMSSMRASPTGSVRRRFSLPQSGRRVLWTGPESF